MSGFESKRAMAASRESREVSYVWVVAHEDTDYDIFNVVGVYTSEAKAKEAQHEHYCNIFMDDEITEADYDGTVTIQQVPLL